MRTFRCSCASKASGRSLDAALVLLLLVLAALYPSGATAAPDQEEAVLANNQSRGEVLVSQHCRECNIVRIRCRPTERPPNIQERESQL